MAATRQKDMNASIALVATRTRAPTFAAGNGGVVAEDVREFIEAGQPKWLKMPLSTSARLAVGLGLKGVLPRAGWAGLTDSPRRKLLPVAGPPLPLRSGIGR